VTIYDLKRNHGRNSAKSLTCFLAISSSIDLTWSDESCRVEAFFPGQISVAETLSREIRTTKSKLLLSLYDFNNPAVADELLKLAKRGFKVC
jgi:hypothetical protein